MALEQLEVKWDEEAFTEGISDGLVSANSRISVSGTDSNPRRVSVIRGIDPLIMTICPLWGCLPEIIVPVEGITVVDGLHFFTANFDGQLLHHGAAQVLKHSPVDIFNGQHDREASLAVPITITSYGPRLGNRTSSCWFWSMLLGLFVMTTDFRTPLTLKASRRERYGLSLRPNSLEAMVTNQCSLF